MMWVGCEVVAAGRRAVDRHLGTVQRYGASHPAQLVSRLRVTRASALALVRPRDQEFEAVAGELPVAIAADQTNLLGPGGAAGRCRGAEHHRGLAGVERRSPNPIAQIAEGDDP